MPNKPRTFKGGRSPQSKRWADPSRKTAQQRGYDSAWTKLRNAYIAEHPDCEICHAAGKLVEAEQVDHIKPFKGVGDPLRLDWDNLRSVCLSCHRKAEHARR